MKLTQFRNLIREEVRNVIKEDVSITDWDEFVNPDYILLTLSNGKKLKISKQHIKGGKAAYQSILTLLGNMDHGMPANLHIKAKSAMLALVNAMLTNLKQK